jgi:plasmid stabilization system protein ParE
MSGPMIEHLRAAMLRLGFHSGYEVVATYEVPFAFVARMVGNDSWPFVPASEEKLASAQLYSYEHVGEAIATNLAEHPEEYRGCDVVVCQAENRGCYWVQFVRRNDRDGRRIAELTAQIERLRAQPVRRELADAKARLAEAETIIAADAVRVPALEGVVLAAMRYAKAQSARYQRELLEAIDALERTPKGGA